MRQADLRPQNNVTNGPSEHFNRVPKNDIVNMRIKRGLPPSGGGGDRHLSCLGGAQHRPQITKEISIELPITLRTVASDISKSLEFYTLA